MKEINSVFKAGMGSDFPFSVPGGARSPGTRYQIIALQHTSVFPEPGLLGKLTAVTKTVADTYAMSHQYIEIQGKNGCIYTIGLGYIPGSPKSVIFINDFAFTNCTKKNKKCFEDIIGNNRYHVYNKTNRDGTITESHTITDLQGCNQLCGQMTGMRQDGLNNYTPIGTRRWNIVDRSEDSAGRILEVNHLKFIRNLIATSNLRKDKVDDDRVKTPTLLVQTALTYDKTHHAKLKNPMLQTVAGYFGKADVVCAQDDMTNCRSFSENFRDDISQLVNTFQTTLQSVRPNTYEMNMGALNKKFPITYKIISKAKLAAASIAQGW
jgi:hypothetical protein